MLAFPKPAHSESSRFLYPAIYNTVDSGTTIAAAVADVTTTMMVPPGAIAGTPVTVLVRFGNNGPSTAAGVTYTVTLATGLTDVACSEGGVSCAYNAATGALTLTGMPGSLTSGQSVVFTVSYTSEASAPVAISAAIATSTGQGANVAPDNANASTSIVAVADVTTMVTAPPSTNAGSPVSVSVGFVNNGPSTAAGVTYTVALAIGQTGVACSGGGVTCTYNATTGALTLAGMPESLTSGQSVAFIVSYTAPASGTVTVSSQVGTSTLESNTANNTVNSDTTIVAVADVTTTVTAPPSANAGSLVTVLVGFANNGPSMAAGAAYTVTLATGLTGVACSGGGVSCAYNAITGALALTGMPGSLTSGQSVEFAVSYTAPPSGPVTISAAIATSTNQRANVAPDNANGSTSIVAVADVTTAVTAPPSANAGSPVSVSVGFVNNGLSTAAGLKYTVTLAAGLIGVACSGGGVTCTYDMSTGALTLAALPGSLVNGQTVAFTVSYAAPGSGVVTVRSVVATSTSQGPNVAPDAAEARTVIVAAVPTMSQWGFAVFALTAAAVAMHRLRSRKPGSTVGNAGRRR